METKKYEVKIKKLPHAQVELTVSIPVDVFDKTRSEAIKHIGAGAELPGFRKGHVPEKMLIAKIELSNNDSAENGSDRNPSTPARALVAIWVFFWCSTLKTIT